MADSLLIIEDEDLLRGELERHYVAAGWLVHAADSLSAARELVLGHGLEPLVVVSDMNLPDGNALDLLDEFRRRELGGEWIVLTGFGTIPDSVRALRLGAFEFLEKPCPIERLDLVVTGAARGGRAQRRLEDQAREGTRRHPVDAFVGSSEAARSTRDLLSQLAAVQFGSLLLGGETGTGKGLAARILHNNGPRARGPMVEVNCAAMPEELLESELFGHEPGAFTGARRLHRGLMEQANEGTLFLDEIGELSPRLQAKLLKVLEEQKLRRVGGEHEIEVDVRVVAASNRNLQECMEGGEFREDLYHRLNVFRIDLPPLRERKADLDELVPLFVADYNAKAGKRVSVISDDVWDRLRAYDWPGNVRELRNVIERCVLLAKDERLPEEWLQLSDPRGRSDAAADSGRPELGLTLDGSLSLDEVERLVIQRVLERADGNVTAAARVLGITRQTLRYRMGKHGLGSDA